MDEREKRLSENLGPHRVRLDELNQPWFVGDVTTVALMLWFECLRLMDEREWVKVSERLPEPYTEVLAFTAYDKGTHLTHIQPDGTWYRGKAVTHWREIVLPTEGGKE